MKSLQGNLTLWPWWLRFPSNDRTVEINKLFLDSLFSMDLSLRSSKTNNWPADNFKNRSPQRVVHLSPRYSHVTLVSRCLFDSCQLNITYIYVIHRLGGPYWEKLCPRSWVRPRAVLRPRAQFLPVRTDLGRWITFLSFSCWDLKVSGKLQPPTYVCWRRARSCWCLFKARDRLQTKTKHDNMILTYNLYYHN